MKALISFLILQIVLFAHQSTNWVANNTIVNQEHVIKKSFNKTHHSLKNNSKTISNKKEDNSAKYRVRTKAWDDAFIKNNYEISIACKIEYFLKKLNKLYFVSIPSCLCTQDSLRGPPIFSQTV